MRILIVDDEFVSLQKLTLLLKSRGVCDAATSGEQAFEMFCQAFETHEPYDLVTLDVNMPGLSGPEVLQKIRRFEEEHNSSCLKTRAKIMMVTAMSDGKTIMASFKEGCEGYLTKPFNKEEIEKSLAALAC